MTTADVLAHFEGVKRVGDRWMAQCPAHDDRQPSLSISEAPDGKTLLKCHAGCTTARVVGAVGLDIPDLFADAPSGNRVSPRRIVATYPYHDEAGNLLYEAIRYDPKDFRQRAADGSWSIKGIRRVPYRLPEVLQTVQAGRIVFIVEGERDADRLHGLGLAATCNACGAGNWTAELSEHLRGARVVILPDNDNPGRNHGHDVAKKLVGIAAEVRIVDLPGLPHNGDVSDWLNAGGTVEELNNLVDSEPIWTTHNAPESLTLDNAALVASPAAALAEGPTTLPGLKLQRLGDLLAEPEEETEWLVEGMLPTGGLSLLVAKPKVGKSTLARTLALAIARGERFLERETAQGPVIHLALEEKKSQLVNQYRALGGTEDDEILIFADTAPKDAVRLLEEAVILYQPRLVIVDTVQRLIRVSEVKDYGKVIAALEPILTMARKHGAHLMLLHHSPKAVCEAIDAAIGSTGWAGTVDTIMVMKRTQDLRTLATVQRYGEDLPETVLVADDTGSVSVGGTRQDHDKQRTAEAVIEFLARHPGSDQTEIRSGVDGHSTALIREAITSLHDAGRVRREGAGKKGDPHRYFLVPEYQSADAGSQNNENQHISFGVNELKQEEILVPTLRGNSGNQYSEDKRERFEI